MELLQLAIVGAIVSLITQAIKKYAGTSEYMTIAAVVVLSLLAGAVYFFLGNTAFWPHFIQVLTFAGAVYAYFIQRFPGASSTP